MESAAFKTAELNGVISSLKMQHSNEIDQYASKVRNLEMDLDQLRIRLRVASEELDRTKAQLTNSNEVRTLIPRRCRRTHPSCRRSPRRSRR